MTHSERPLGDQITSFGALQPQSSPFFPLRSEDVPLFDQYIPERV
jgi:hypothetical protein